MDFSFTPEENSFREEVRAFMAAELPQDIRDTHFGFRRHTWEQMFRWHKIVANKGWVAPYWPVEYGGTGWTPVQQYIFDEEAMLAGAPRLRPFGLKMIGPVLIRYGSDEQKAHFLPRILSGEDYWCQGFSEPGAGSDLASLNTRAVRDGDIYKVNGQKTWTTTGQHANWMFTLVRTDPTAEKPQQGISLLLIDMNLPGVEVRPIITIDGDHHVNEVFLNDVEVPASMLVGEENKAWTYAKFLLGNERVGIANVGQNKAELRLLRLLALKRQRNGGPLIEDPVFAAKLADLETDFMALEITNLRMLSSIKPGGDSAELAPFLKLRGSEIQQRTNELAMEAAGPRAAVWEKENSGDAVLDRYGTHGWLLSRAFTIFGGSSEVMKNIVAKQTLRL
ncbi:acyl-CoA dehydrogenase family protein [Phaeobacter sp. J2-8]|uniref:acyl-CoA dehydrogenase family protein n=1 Tax=Phaeobacter sp. J2-8 TaxID=2931394 RepID=UPI001FD3ADE7|nr:acyl-CoA dehydrogenase family protein [Phaeobacter sp. J2-8]MCJ7873407.1 acyl-CoA dehydrogenase family protein [Phaeobacter sp. J2-8]